jgi:hypothetical protein
MHVKSINLAPLSKKSRILKASKLISVINKINTSDLAILELALSFLYLGEGSKEKLTSIGNANPLVLRFLLMQLGRYIQCKTWKMSATFTI